MGSEFVERALAKAGPPIALAFCGALSAGLGYVYFLAGKFGNDFGVYWRTANLPAEAAYGGPWVYPFPYAPTMLLWIQPLALIPKWSAYFAFIAVSVVALVLACRPYLSKTAIAIVLVTKPFARGIYTGQVCALLAALLIWACGARNRVLAGIAFGLIATIKPHLVIMAPLMLVLNRDWRAIFSATITVASAVLLALVVFGPERWLEWVGSLDGFHQAVVNINGLDIGVTPAMWAERLGLAPLPFMLAGALIGAALVYLCRQLGPLGQSAAIVAGSLMAAPYALDYDLIALFPFLALMVAQGRICAIVGLIAAFHPAPLAITAYELLRKASFPLWRARHATV